MHALAKKTRADIITMNATLSDVFLANLPKLICNGYDPICMGLPNTVFLHMFDWFIKNMVSQGLKKEKRLTMNGRQLATHQWF
jgi:hypothetical protein